jgi:hypothetical protein
MACHGLDTRECPVINHCVRGLAAMLVLFASATAVARPRVHVAPFSVRGEALGYFGPEVARAVEAALEGAGVETGVGAEATLAGQVEELGGDRVRLSASLQKRTFTAEGPLEAVDAVATQLANQIAPLLLENDPAAQRAAERRARDAARRAAAVPPSRPTRVARVEVAKAEAKKSEPVAGEPTAASKPEAAPESSAASAAPKPEPAGEVKPEVKPAEPTKPEAKTEPPKPDWVPPRVDVEAPPTPPTAAPPTYPPPYYGGYVRGRVVAHTVADPPSSYPGAAAGTMATQALYSFLHRRMRLSVIPTGVGITPATVAADEGYRAAARAVVMARLDSVEFLPGAGARVRLEVVVVRDGRQVMRRAVDSAPSDPNRRVSGPDPIYQAVTMALEALVPELVGALADVR